MGEAKSRQRALRADFNRVLDMWSFPPSDAEAATVAAVQGLPSVIVERESAERLAWAGMKPRLCHDSCAWYARNDPTGQTKVVTGWMREPTGNYVLHAVVAIGSVYRCITPTPGEPSRFLFIPHPDIETVRQDDLKYRHTRKGYEIGAGIRPDPKRHFGTLRSCASVWPREWTRIKRWTCAPLTDCPIVH